MRLLTARLALAALLSVIAGCGQQKKTEDAVDPNADSLVKLAEKGPVSLRVRFTPRDPRLSDRIEFELTVKAEPDVEIIPPLPGAPVGEFIVRDYREHGEKIENNKRVKRFTYQLEAAHAGKHLVRSASVEFIDKRANSESKDAMVLLETEPLEVNVTSTLGEQTPNLADLAPMAAPIEIPSRTPLFWVFVALGVLAAWIAGMSVYFMHKKVENAKVIVRKPEEIAEEELNQLMAENLPEKGLFAEFYVRLTGIVRRYIERTTGIQAAEQTTEEFLRDPRTRQLFSFERAQQLGGFLEAADMVKYAAMQPGQRQIEESVARAREFVGLTSALSPLPQPAGAVK